MYDHYLDVQGGQFVDTEQLAQHAVQSIVWATFGAAIGVLSDRSDARSDANYSSACSGCFKLARVEEDIVTAFTDVGGDDNNRLTVTLNRAYHVSLAALLTVRYINLCSSPLTSATECSTRKIRRIHSVPARTRCLAGIAHPRLQPLGFGDLEHSRPSSLSPVSFISR